MEDVTCSCGAVNDYTAVPSGPHIKAICNKCHRYIKFLPQDKIQSTLYFGKYKGREISSMNSEEEINYLKWLRSTPDIKPKLKESIQAQLTRLNRA